jgi:hypothetical protein
VAQADGAPTEQVRRSGTHASGVVRVRLAALLVGAVFAADAIGAAVAFGLPALPNWKRSRKQVKQ